MAKATIKPNAVIPTKVNVCPLVPSYGTKGKCGVETCQNHNLISPTGCLLRDRAENESKITDAEILHYKIRPRSAEFGSKSLDTKFSAYIRKRHVVAAKSNMIFYMFVQYVKEKFAPHPKFNYTQGYSKFLDQMISEFPFTQEDSGFEPWMLPYLSMPKIFNTFVEGQNRKISESISLVNVLGITPGKYKNLKHSIQTFTKVKTSKDKT